MHNVQLKTYNEQLRIIELCCSEAIGASLIRIERRKT